MGIFALIEGLLPFALSVVTGIEGIFKKGSPSETKKNSALSAVTAVASAAQTMTGNAAIDPGALTAQVSATIDDTVFIINYVHGHVWPPAAVLQSEVADISNLVSLIQAVRGKAAKK